MPDRECQMVTIELEDLIIPIFMTNNLIKGYYIGATEKAQHIIDQGSDNFCSAVAKEAATRFPKNSQ